jgi:hypothetical protein
VQAGTQEDPGRLAGFGIAGFAIGGGTTVALKVVIDPRMKTEQRKG